MINSSALRFFSSSIGLKQLVGATGLALCGFLVTHMAANFLILVGPDAFNMYAHKLTSNPLIYVAEAALAGIFLMHLGLAMRLAFENKAARPERYAVKRATGRGTTFASRTMPLTGVLILIFLIVHLLNLKFGTYFETELDGMVVRDLYKTTMQYFADPMHTALYVFMMIVVGIHTSHGFGSAFQSLGLNHPKYNPLIKLSTKLYGLIIAVGFSGIAIWSFLQGQGA